MDANTEQAISVLRSWHTVEFFQPYSIPDKSDPKLGHIKVSLEELSRERENVLPWLSLNACHQLNIDENRSDNFVLYLGVFDKSVLKNMCDVIFDEESNPVKKQEFEERYDSQGETCFAKLTLDPWGRPDFISMSLSTLPWAMGHLQNNSFSELTLTNFDKRCELLGQAIERISSSLPTHPQNALCKTLDAQSLYQLLNELYQWAQFTPPEHFSFILDWYSVKEKKPEKTTLTDDKQSLKSESIERPNEAPHNDVEEVKSQRVRNLNTDERVMPILNSFYIEDIQRVINSVAQGNCNKALLDYLMIRQNKKPDLYTQDGLDLIVENLKPDLMPPGRWPSSPSHNMSLMQQFAINTAFLELKDQGLLSVNGPPGTGKTTLLRDVVAQNVVARAKVLASFEKATDGLTEQGFPIEALTGFEMVVASSNNLAVENISKELPLLSSIADEFASLDHYKPVANQLNALKTKKGYQPLSDDEQCWGVICAVLGRQKNRSRFVESFFFDSHFAKETVEETQRPDAYNMLNFYRWMGIHTKPNFFLAKQAFKQEVANFERQITQLQQMAELQAWLAANSEHGPDEQAQYDAKLTLFNQLKVTHKDKVLPTPGMKIDDAQLQRNAFFQDEAINRIRSKIFIAALKLHQAWVASAYHSDSFRQAIYRIKDVLRGYDCEDSKPIWQLLFMLVPVVSTTFASFSRMFKSLKAGDLGWLMIDEAGQAVPQAAVGGIWRAKRVLVVGDPQQIEPVFTTAPKLTQSICQGILANDAPHWDPRYWSVQQICDRANAYGCQLNVMNQQQWIGIPLWVHRRCIEPMFSIANTIAYDNRMIHGSPTEQITALEHHVLGSNHWQVSQGICTFKQYKNELGQDTLALLLQLIGKKCDLNEVYVITPFRAVKQQLINHMDNHRREICQMAGLTLKEYYQWRQKHIGTVHTFQGKENKTVILVLGCDSQNTGGANWAASKPNLLNVALTRAKRNIFVVGDPYVWRNRRYFSQLADKLVFIT